MLKFLFNLTIYFWSAIKNDFRGTAIIINKIFLNKANNSLKISPIERNPFIPEASIILGNKKIIISGF